MGYSWNSEGFLLNSLCFYRLFILAVEHIYNDEGNIWWEDVANKTSSHRLPYKSSVETVVCSYFSMLHLTFFTLTDLRAGLNTSAVKWSKLMKAKWRLGCYMSCPKGSWQIKWFVMVEGMDNALWEKLNHEENWNNSEERFGLLLTTHVRCSLCWFLSLQCRVRHVYGLLLKQNIILKGVGMGTVRQSCLGSGRTSAVTITQSLCSTGAFFVFCGLSWILLHGCQRGLDCFYCLHGWLRKNIGYWDLALVCTHTQIIPQGGNYTWLVWQQASKVVISERSDQPWTNKLRVWLDVSFKHSGWRIYSPSTECVCIAEDMGQDV